MQTQLVQMSNWSDVTSTPSRQIVVRRTSRPSSFATDWKSVVPLGRRAILPQDNGSKVLRLIAFLIALTVGFLGMTEAVCAQQPTSPLKPKTNSLITNDDGLGALLLKDGRVLQGRVRRVSTGYLVSSKTGNLAIPGEDVRHAAQDVGEIYLQLRYELKDPSVKEHLNLAEWCLKQRLFQFAERELAEVVRRDPTHEEARRVLKRLDIEREQAEDVSTASQLLAPTPSTQDEDARSLAGLAPSTVQQFVSQVQPVLLNKCSNGRCHGASSDNGFRLTRLPPGASNHRLYTERNVASILKFIDLNDASESAVLKVTTHSHAGRPVFSGAGATEQQRALTNWVQVVSTELRPKKPLVKLTSTAPVAETKSTASTATVREASAPGASEVPRASRRDAFSPDEFNSLPGTKK